jgi:hypothetical protein
MTFTADSSIVIHRVLAFVPARAQAEDEAPRAHVVHGHGGLGSERGVAVRVRQDEMAELEALRPRGECGEHRERLVRAAAGVSEANEMVEEPAGVEDGPLVGELPRRDERRPVDVGLGRLQADLHGPNLGRRAGSNLGLASDR